MKPEETLPRLDQVADDPALRRAIDAARRDKPSPERMQMLSAALAAKLVPGGPGGGGAPGGGSTAPPPAAAPATGAGSATGASAGAIAAKVGGLVVALAVAGALVQAARSHSAEPPKAPATPVFMQTSASEPTPIAPDPAPSAEPIPTVTLEQLPELAPSASAKTRASAEPPAPHESDMALLRRAQDALASKPQSALALLNEHQRTYPRSSYSQEREVLTIDALVRLGRRSEAEARADRFARAFPNSGHNRRIDTLLGR